MLGRFLPRTPGVYHVLMLVIFLLFVVYELKHLFDKFQKEKRIEFYNDYVNEVSHSVDVMKESVSRNSKQIKELTKVLQVIFKKNLSGISSSRSSNILER